MIEDFFTPRESAAWIAYAEKAGFEECTHPPTVDMAFRDNGRLVLMSEVTADRIWQRMQLVVSKIMGSLTAPGCYDKIRLYRYGKGQRFGEHVDESATTGVEEETTAITVFIYLNDRDPVGGETVFYRGNYGDSVAVCYKPTQGSLLFHGYVECVRMYRM